MNDTVTFVDILQQFNDDTASIFFTSSIQPFTEAFVLLLNIFVIVFATNSTIRRIQIMRALGSADTASDAKVIRHIKMVRAAAPLFLLPRALHSALQATVAAFQSTDDACLGVCNISCTNRFALLRSWLDFHPELHTLVVLVSALLLLLTIWSSGRVDRVQQRFNALYVPSHDRNSQLLRHDSLSIHLHRNLPIRHARSITTEDLDRSTSSYLHSPVPATASNEPSRCSICLAHLTGGDKVRLLPCMHFYHQDCIDPWIMQQNHCPVCRHKVVSPPAAVVFTHASASRA